MAKFRALFHRRNKESTSKSSSSGNGQSKAPSIGLELLVDPKSATLDIVFVHGLGGDRDGTWKAAGADAPWPRELLRTMVPHARMFTFGYDSHVVDWRAMVSKNNIGNHAKNLLAAIANQRDSDDTNNRPIAFAAHSMGGLVCEDALLSSRNSAEMFERKILESTIGILFLGTPHSGSGLAIYAEHLARYIGVLKQTNPKIVEVLRADSEVLARIQSDFHTMLRARAKDGEREISIVCFYEEMPLPGFGEVVPMHSAILPSYRSIGIHENHIGMTKFASLTDPGFVSFSQEVKRLSKSLNTTEGPLQVDAQSRANFDDVPVSSTRSQTQDAVPTQSASINQPSSGSNAAGYQPSGPTSIGNTGYPSSTSVSDEQLIDDSLDSLFLTNPRDTLTTLISTKGNRARDTCEWMFDEDEFKSWMLETSRLLWISGGPGQGKTMLAMFLAQQLEGGGCEVAYFFCSNQDPKRNTSVALMRGILYQILSRHRDLAMQVHRSFSRRNQSFANITSFEALWRVFEGILSDWRGKPLFCILDGLDEITDEVEIEVLMSRVQALYSAHSNKLFGTDHETPQPINLAIFSRSKPECILDALSAHTRLDLETKFKQRVDRDIERYIETRVMELSERNRYTKGLREKVTERLLEGSKGTFLWVSLLCQELRRKVSNEVLATLEHFPHTLDGTYERMLLQIEPERRSIAAKILHIVAAVDRPLSLLELGTLLSADDELHAGRRSTSVSALTATIAQQLANSGAGSSEAMRRLSRSEASVGAKSRKKASSVGNRSIGTPGSDEQNTLLLTASKGIDTGSSVRSVESHTNSILSSVHDRESIDTINNTRDRVFFCGYFLKLEGDDYNPKVIFYHHSIKDFLTHLEAIESEEIEVFREDAKTTHSKIAKICFEYIHRSPLAYRDVQLVERKRFDVSDTLGIQSLAVLALENIGATDSLFNQMLCRINADDDILSTHPLLSYATIHWLGHAQRAHAEHIKDLFDPSQIFYDEKTKIRNQWFAAYWTVRELGKCPESFSILHMAAYFGIDELIETIIGSKKFGKLKGVDIRDNHGQSPLSYAAANGHYETVKLLLDKGADPKFAVSSEWAAEKWLRLTGSPVLSRLYSLSRSGNSRKPLRSTSLHVATINAQVDIMKLLLERGADVDAMDELDGGTSLNRAAFVNSYAAAELLLQNRASPDLAKDITPLGIAVREGNESLIGLLIRHGADPQHVDIRGRSMTHYCVVSGSERIVKLILDQGVDVLSKDQYGSAPIHRAARFGHEPIIDMLLEYGADPNVRDGEGRTPLHLAAVYGHGDAVWRLSAGEGHKELINALDNGGSTARTLAQRNGYTQITENLELAEMGKL